MSKILALLCLAVAVMFVAPWKSDNKPVPPPDQNSTLSESLKLLEDGKTLGVTTGTSTTSWKFYTNEDFGFRIKYPQELIIDENRSGIISIGKERIHIDFSFEKISVKDSLNTKAEKDIDILIAKMGEKFKLIDSISEVAIGSITGITYTTEENSVEITYFYVPLKDGFLVIRNLTDSTDSALISISDDIIYSLELL